MSITYLLAHRIHRSKGDDTQRVSPPAVRIAIAGIAIGVAVMLVTVAIVVGFKQEVRARIVDFGGHLQLQAWTPNQTYELPPFVVDDSLAAVLQAQPHVTSLRGTVTKTAVLKADSAFECVVCKGSVPLLDASDALAAAGDALPDADALADANADDAHADASDALPAVDGRNTSPLAEREIALSQTLANRLRVGVGDQVTAYFVQNALAADALSLSATSTKVRARRLTVASLYQTHLSEIDQQMVLANASLLQGISGWDDNMYSTVEVRIDDFDRMQTTADMLNALRMCDPQGVPLIAQGIDRLNPNVFSWLALLDTNVWVILLMIAAVAAFTMISGLLIIILERTQMIGILKAQGMANGDLRRVFLWVGLLLTGRGLLWGNLLGLGLCFVQWQWHLLTLDPETYYLEWVPISLSPLMVVAVNVGTVLVTLAVLIGPTALVSGVMPVRTLEE